MTLTHDEPLVRRRRFTVDEYHRMAAAGVFHEDDRVELLEGEVVIMSPIGNKHAACVRRLNNLLVVRAAGRAIVDVQDPVQLDPHSESQPDVTLLRPRADFYAAAAPGPADTLLVIEVGDSSVRFDRHVKAPLYARAGVRELWLIDVNADEVRVCRRAAEGGYDEVLVKGRGDALSPEALPDLSLTVDEGLG